MKKLKLARKFIESQGGFVSTKTPAELGLVDNGNGTLSRPTLHAADGGDVPQKTLICGWCGNHRKGELNDDVFCSCGGRSWLICTLGCLEHEQPTAANA